MSYDADRIAEARLTEALTSGAAIPGAPGACAGCAHGSIHHRKGCAICDCPRYRRGPRAVSLARLAAEQLDGIAPTCLPLTLDDVGIALRRIIPPWSLLRLAQALDDPAAVKTWIRTQVSRGGYHGGRDPEQPDPDAHERLTVERDGIHCHIETREQVRAGVLRWPQIVGYVRQGATEERTARLRAAVTADSEHYAGMVRCPGPYGDADTWWREYGTAYYAEATRLHHAERIAAEVIWGQAGLRVDRPAPPKDSGASRRLLRSEQREAAWRAERDRRAAAQASHEQIRQLCGDVPEHARPPIAGGQLWERVVAAAARQCQCEGECGRSHAATARPGSGPRPRCPEGDRYGRPLHAVPRRDSGTAQASALPAEELLAYCPTCHSGVRRKAAQWDREQARRSADTLF